MTLMCKNRFNLFFALLVAACSPMPTSFEQVEEDRVRTIDFVYRNRADTTLCEAAPGDSMEVIALFAGEKVHDIALSASFDVQTSMYGKASSFNEGPLDYTVTRSSLQDSGATEADTFAFRFKIPRDMLKTSSFLPEHEWVSVLPVEIRSTIPSSIASMSKTEIIAMLERFSEMEGMDSLSSSDTADPADDSLSSMYRTQFLPSAGTILQLFSASIELKAFVNGNYEILSYCTVRYHRSFRHLDTAVICNKNPVITRMGIYRVRQNNLTYFDPTIHTQPYEPIVLFDAAAGITLSDYTLAIEKDESYFLFAESDSQQQALSISGVPITETHLFEWFFQQDFTGVDTIELKERLSLYNTSDGPIVPLIPAATEAVDRCAVWVQVRDEAPGSRLYPTGSSVYRTRFFFTYSQDYLKDSGRLR
ncbi:MAG: hypothetical protein JW913_11380 [Chitinispirillaceae bacterium]|nr:hypothetical protein [Chitinispirillaceae bacterium]